MTKSRTAAMIAVSLGMMTAITGAAIIVAPTAAIAADAKADPKKTIGPKVGKPLQEAIAAVKANKLADALAKAQEAEKITPKTPYETYLIYQVLTNIYLQQKDYGGAAKSLEAEQATGEMSAQESNTALKQVIAIDYQLKNYPKVIEIGGKYLKDGDPNDVDIAVMVAQAQYLQNNFKATIDGINAAMKSAKSQGKPLKEDWLQLLMSAENKAGDDAGTQAALAQLIAVNPTEAYWKNLMQYADRATRNAPNATKTALDLYFIKLQVGLLATDKEYSDMAQLALQDGLPGSAKTVVDKGFKAGVLGTGANKDRETRLQTMANTQAASDEKALAQGETEARKAKTGDALVKAGEAYWSYGQYDKAAEVMQEGITKGVTSADDAKLRLGIVYISAGKRPQAADAFKGIAPGSVPAQIASLWMLAATSPPKKA